MTPSRGRPATAVLPPNGDRASRAVVASVAGGGESLPAADAIKRRDVIEVADLIDCIRSQSAATEVGKGATRRREPRRPCREGR